VFLADRGIVTRANLEALRETNGVPCITTVKARSVTSP
jgi:hypothetical protein